MTCYGHLLVSLTAAALGAASPTVERDVDAGFLIVMEPQILSSAHYSSHSAQGPTENNVLVLGCTLK